jgi:hypothetical protein
MSQRLRRRAEDGSHAAENGWRSWCLASTKEATIGKVVADFRAALTRGCDLRLRQQFGGSHGRRRTRRRRAWLRREMHQAQGNVVAANVCRRRCRRLRVGRRRCNL